MLFVRRHRTSARVLISAGGAEPPRSLRASRSGSRSSPGTSSSRGPNGREVVEELRRRFGWRAAHRAPGVAIAAAAVPGAAGIHASEHLELGRGRRRRRPSAWYLGRERPPRSAAPPALRRRGGPVPELVRVADALQVQGALLHVVLRVEYRLVVDRRRECLQEELEHRARLEVAEIQLRSGAPSISLTRRSTNPGDRQLEHQGTKAPGIERPGECRKDRLAGLPLGEPRAA